VNDHYHRPKQEVVQKVMEAIGENPKECISQEDLDKYSELDTVRDVFLAIGLDPQKLELQLCEPKAGLVSDCHCQCEAKRLGGGPPGCR
jgi:hypothetical protein